MTQWLSSLLERLVTLKISLFFWSWCWACCCYRWMKGKEVRPAYQSSPSRTSRCSQTRLWKKKCNLSADAARRHPLDPVELGAIGKVGLVGDDKCEREEGGDSSWLSCPSHKFKFKLKCKGCIFIICCTWRILPPYPIPPGHRMIQASRKGPWLLLPADVMCMSFIPKKCYLHSHCSFPHLILHLYLSFQCCPEF